ncbi:Toll-like receptor 13 [Wickerhamomyces ciferrii]|uniref:Toll-like receptor 13 n=1 Tax=Wickerhamomyces ciferrii (strain ATCC 14091 / BCRC 22168 / CBS 111 / JCM 3599 / NBRC 0793 / NRRL Y-1031 F-60-10) TaxID=1206466 RepID=K0KLQ5_WICCF|nr:Toll-like receptor 13 [Wickerhamomyces ciferrii]CCH43921.1 Toll-like receptor 13 [Wickerhamomyces ciferrii]
MPTQTVPRRLDKYKQKPLYVMTNITVPQTSLNDLPIHIIDKITSDLESNDLINLLNADPSLHYLFTQDYKLVTDLSQDSYDSLPQDFLVTVDKALHSPEVRNFKGTLLLECHDTESSWAYFFELISLLSTETSCEITIYNIESIPFELQEEFHKLVSITASNPGFIKKIHLPDVTTLHLLMIDWDPSVFKLPNVTYLGLGDTTIVDNNVDKELYIPNLEQLYIEGSLNGDLSKLEKIIPSTLHLNEIVKPIDFTKFKYNNLKFLKIESSNGIDKIDDVLFPNLQHLEIINTNIPLISNIKANKLESLIYNSSYYSSISLENFQAENLQQIDIIASSIDHITNVQFPQLKYVKIKLYEQPIPDITNTTFKFLESIEILETEHCIQILDNLTLKKLKIWNIHNDVNYRLSPQTQFPILETLLIAHNEAIQQVPLIYAPNLKNITVLGSFNFVSINNLPKDYPTLTTLVIDNCPVSYINGLEFPNLEVLDIQISSDVFEMNFENNKLPQLKELNISPKVNNSFYSNGNASMTLQWENVEAPNLEIVSINGVQFISKFSTSPYPNLKSLSIDKISDLDIVSNNSLILLNLSHNESIPNLSLGKLPNLEEFYPPIQIDDNTLRWVEDLKKSISEELNSVSDNFGDLKV